MSRIAFLVDGFNLFHALDHNPSGPNPKRYHRYKWLSLSKLARAYITSSDTIAGVYYFTTLATWDPAKVAKHKLFIRAISFARCKWTRNFGIATAAMIEMITITISNSMNVKPR